MLVGREVVLRREVQGVELVNEGVQLENGAFSAFGGGTLVVASLEQHLREDEEVLALGYQSLGVGLNLLSQGLVLRATPAHALHHAHHHDLLDRAHCPTLHSFLDSSHLQQVVVLVPVQRHIHHSLILHLISFLFLLCYIVLLLIIC